MNNNAKILVVGVGGYIGKNFAEYAAFRKNSSFTIDMVSSRDNVWALKNFAGYDSVIFAVGIAHRKQTKKNRHLYFAVNRDLAVSVAEKAKSAGVRQFIYLSSMAVYGKKEGEISAHTIPNPAHNDYYGTSKFQAENALNKLADENFCVAVIRPPLVYGENCPGKYGKLEKLAKYLPIVPDNKNKRSMIYIDNLSEFLCTVIESQKGGIFRPQDSKYTNTALLIKHLRRQKGKKTVIFGAGLLLRLCMAVFPPIKTAFGNLYYCDTD
ncbi:MAG: NAD-dependent epimerase/dehydratase family protein [Defluviitaleaceae bacterium]|nr:NAD-dependent epimerase/dehydratase family protein [Defluviitaleaceae bacterium]